MLNKFRGPFFGQRPRGKVVISPYDGIAGTIFYINVSEFNPSSKVLLFFYTPENKIFFQNEYSLDKNGNLEGGYLSLNTENYPKGKYTVYARGFYKKTESTVSRKFEIK